MTFRDHAPRSDQKSERDAVVTCSRVSVCCMGQCDSRAQLSQTPQVRKRQEPESTEMSKGRGRVLDSRISTRRGLRTTSLHTQYGVERWSRVR